MPKTNFTVLESLNLSRNLVKEIKNQQTKKDQINKKKKPPKWLLGRETLYEPKKKFVTN